MPGAVAVTRSARQEKRVPTVTLDKSKLTQVKAEPGASSGWAAGEVVVLATFRVHLKVAMARGHLNPLDRDRPLDTRQQSQGKAREALRPVQYSNQSREKKQEEADLVLSGALEKEHPSAHQGQSCKPSARAWWEGGVLEGQ